MTRVSGVLGALLGSVFLVSCSSNAAPERASQTASPFSPEAPGRYSVGDSFTFDNPTLTWSVVSIEGDRVHWRSDRGDEQITGHNPLLPAVEWKNPDQGGGRRSISDVKGALFPLEVGNRMTFTSAVESWTTTEGEANEPQTWRTNWSCNVAGKERIDVQAGNFDTFKIQCGRYKPTELVFYYAPRIGHYVVTRIDDASGQGTVTRNLVSFRRIALGGERVAEIPPPQPPTGVEQTRVAPVPPAPAAAPPAPAAAPPPPPEPAPPRAKILEQPPANAAAAATGSGPRVVLGLFSTQENAARGWGIYQKENRDLLGSLQPHIVPSGRYFRVATERMQDRAAAAELCSELKARGMECLVTGN